MHAGFSREDREGVGRGGVLRGGGQRGVAAVHALPVPHRRHGAGGAGQVPQNLHEGALLRRPVVPVQIEKVPVFGTIFWVSLRDDSEMREGAAVPFE